MISSFRLNVGRIVVAKLELSACQIAKPVDDIYLWKKPVDDIFHNCQLFPMLPKGC